MGSLLFTIFSCWARSRSTSSWEQLNHHTGRPGLLHSDEKFTATPMALSRLYWFFGKVSALWAHLFIFLLEDPWIPIIYSGDSHQFVGLYFQHAFTHIYYLQSLRLHAYWGLYFNCSLITFTGHMLATTWLYSTSFWHSGFIYCMFSFGITDIWCDTQTFDFALITFFHLLLYLFIYLFIYTLDWAASSDTYLIHLFLWVYG